MEKSDVCVGGQLVRPSPAAGYVTPHSDKHVRSRNAYFFSVLGVNCTREAKRKKNQQSPPKKKSAQCFRRKRKTFFPKLRYRVVSLCFGVCGLWRSPFRPLCPRPRPHSRYHLQRYRFLLHWVVLVFSLSRWCHEVRRKRERDDKSPGCLPRERCCLGIIC